MSRTLRPDSARENRSAKSRVLQAASKLFAANGFRGTSVRQIANRAKVNEVTVFRLFSSKRSLYKEVLESKLEKAAPLWLPSPVDATVTVEDEIFGALARDLQRTFDSELVRLLFFAALENREELRKSVSPRMDRFYELLADHLQKQMEKGMIRDADPRVMAKALVTLIVYDRFSNDFLSGESVPTDDQTASLLQLWLHGVTRSQIEGSTVAEVASSV